MTRPISIGRRLLVLVGVLSLCAALVVLFGPSIAETPRWPWDDETLLVAFFTVAFVLASLLGPFVLLDETERPVRTDEAPETVPSTVSPGHDLERVLDRRWPASLPIARRRRIRAQFRRTAIQTIVRTTDCSTETARERLEQGTWTDDSVAAAFVRTEPESEPSRLRSLVDRVRFPRRVRRTARAILTRAEAGEGHR